MTPKQDYAKDIQRLLLDCKQQLNEAADQGNFIAEVSRLSEQVASLRRLPKLAS